MLSIGNSFTVTGIARNSHPIPIAVARGDHSQMRTLFTCPIIIGLKGGGSQSSERSHQPLSF